MRRLIGENAIGNALLVAADHSRRSLLESRYGIAAGWDEEPEDEDLGWDDEDDEDALGEDDDWDADPGEDWEADDEEEDYDDEEDRED